MNNQDFDERVIIESLEYVQIKFSDHLATEATSVPSPVRWQVAKAYMLAMAYGMSSSQFAKVFHEPEPVNKVLLLL